jgi:hypothetical protein
MSEGVGLQCREFVELVTDYLERTMPVADRARFEAHIAECVGCARYLEQMRLTIRATGALSEEAIPDAVMQVLLEVFRDQT